MTIAIKPNASARARQLRARHPYLSDADIAELTGMPRKNVKAALGKGELRKRPKSRVR